MTELLYRKHLQSCFSLTVESSKDHDKAKQELPAMYAKDIAFLIMTQS